MRIFSYCLGGVMRLVMVYAMITACGAGIAGAATVIHYDGESGGYVTASTPLNTKFKLPTPVDTGMSVRTWKYSDTTPISPSSGYTGPAIYAALEMNTNSDSFSDFANASGINTGSLAPDSRFSVVSGINNGSITAMVFFKPNLTLGQIVAFDSSSSISLKGVVAGTGNTNTRFVVQNDGLWYISSTVSYRVDGSLAHLTLNAGSASWALFDPVNVAPLPTIPASGYTISGSSFTNITAVGYYTSLTRVDNQTYISLADFTVNATVIPEPASAALWQRGHSHCAGATGRGFALSQSGH